MARALLLAGLLLAVALYQQFFARVSEFEVPKHLRFEENEIRQPDDPQAETQDMRAQTLSWQANFMPEACAHSYKVIEERKRNISNSFLRRAQHTFKNLKMALQDGVTFVDSLDMLPRQYYSLRPFPHSARTHPIKLSKWAEQHLPYPRQLLDPVGMSNSTVMFCFPDGIDIDNSIMGPMTSSEGAIRERFAIKDVAEDWRISSLQGFSVQLDTEYILVPGAVVNLASWQSDYFGHFVLNSLVRLGLVYDLLMSDDPLWGQAKVILGLWSVQTTTAGIDNKTQAIRKTNVNFQPRNAIQSEVTDKMFPTRTNLDIMIEWLFTKLNLRNRILPGMGWRAKAHHTVLAEFMFLPVVYPHPTCTKQPEFAVFARGALLPIQRALGVFSLPPGQPRNLIVYAGRKAPLIRCVDSATEQHLLSSIKDKLITFNRRSGDVSTGSQVLQLELVNFEFTEPAKALNVFRRAVMVIGPHGQQLWNFAMCQPDTVVVEFIRLASISRAPRAPNNEVEVDGKKSVRYNMTDPADTHTQDCRQAGFALANAASLEYFVSEPLNFAFFNRNMVPNVSEVLEILETAVFPKYVNARHPIPPN